MNFKIKTLIQIRLWTWLAMVLPTTALAGTFFIWKFFDGTAFSVALITGETIMFCLAVIWWWWAMYTMKNLVKQWDETKHKVSEVSSDIKDMKSAVIKALSEDK